MPSPVPKTTPPQLTSSQTGTFYFAYGSNLSAKQMSLRLRNSPSSSVPVALARLEGWRWIICERGYANVVAVGATSPSTDTGSGDVRDAKVRSSGGRADGEGEGDGESDDEVVWGIIYNMHPLDESRLDLYEGHDDLRNPEPEVNPNAEDRVSKPFLQGNWDYNKLYLNVSVTRWFRDLADYGVNVDQPNTTAGRNSRNPVSQSANTDAQRGEGMIKALVYVDEHRTEPGEINAEYIGRMNRGIDESVALGLPERWVDWVMRKWVVKGVDVDNSEYVGTDRGYVESERTETREDVRRRVEAGGGQRGGGGWDGLENGEDKMRGGMEVQGDWDERRVERGTW